MALLVTATTGKLYLMSAEELFQNLPGGDTQSFRLLTGNDIPNVMALERAAHSHPWRQSSFENCLKGRQHCLLGFLGNTLAGYFVVAYGGGDAELLNLVVAKDYRRKGFGACLLKYAMAFVKPHADMLFLEVRVSNRAAIALYSQHGFYEVGLRKNYYPTLNGREDALLMGCQLF